MNSLIAFISVLNLKFKLEVLILYGDKFVTNYNFIVKKGPVYKGYKMWVTRALCDTANESEGH